MWPEPVERIALFLRRSEAQARLEELPPGVDKPPGPGARSFPFEGARVIVDRSLLSARTVWLQAGSPRHVLGLGPRQLLRLTRAETGTFLLDD